MRRTLMVLAVAALFAAGGCKKKDQEGGTPPGGEPAGPATTTGPEQAAEPTGATEPPAEPPKAPDPAAILDKALAAAGGLDNLKAKLASVTFESEGTFLGQPYKSMTYWKAPDRMVMAIAEMGMSMGYAPDACWSTMGEIVIDCMKEEQEYSGEGVSFAHAANLYPLKEEGVQVESAGTAEVEGSPAVGVKVSGGFLKMPVTLFFAEDSGLLLKAVYEGHFGMAQGTIEYLYADHREFDGLKLPGASTMTLDGKQIMTEKLLAVRPGELDDARFAKPAQAPLGETKVTAVPEQQVVVTTVNGAYEKLGPAVGALFGWIRQNGLMPMGAPTFVWVKDPSATQNPEEYVTEIRLPVASTGELPAAEEGYEFRTLPAMEIAWRLEQGPYDQVAARYAELGKWAEENGYRLAGPAAMTTFSDPQNTPPEQLLQSLFFPVTKAE
ncbi:MAG: GyrI-like domain-containing protein [Deltaproteobacteria bacterium]|nr:GyrI-like domain-containing protein [Deltaproteobacteria bacterium]